MSDNGDTTGQRRQRQIGVGEECPIRSAYIDLLLQRRREQAERDLEQERAKLLKTLGRVEFPRKKREKPCVELYTQIRKLLKNGHEGKH